MSGGGPAAAASIDDSEDELDSEDSLTLDLATDMAQVSHYVHVNNKSVESGGITKLMATLHSYGSTSTSYICYLHVQHQTNTREVQYGEKNRFFLQMAVDWRKSLIERKIFQCWYDKK